MSVEKVNPAEEKSRYRVLLYSLDGYSTFFTDTNYIFGGIEKETAFHALELARYEDLEVFVVTKDQGHSNSSINNVTIIQHPSIKGAGFWKSKKTIKSKILSKLKRTPVKEIVDFYKEINPDAVFCMGLQPGDLELLDYCKKYNKKFIFKLAHDNELQDRTVDGSPSNGRIDQEMSELVNHAAFVLCQTPLQFDLLKKNYGLEGTMHYNPIDLELKFDISNKQYDLFWVGRSTKFKRPELFIELCRRLPDFKACMVLNKLNHEYWNKLTEDLPSNIELIPSVPADKIDNNFAMTRLFISTSDSEGFANTYLQAAKHSVPVVSMCCDPNEMLSTHKAGVLTGDNMDGLVTTVKTLLEDNETREQLSANARKYVEEFHDLQKITGQLRTMIIEEK